MGETIIPDEERVGDNSQIKNIQDKASETTDTDNGRKMTYAEIVKGKDDNKYMTT